MKLVFHRLLSRLHQLQACSTCMVLCLTASTRHAGRVTELMSREVAQDNMDVTGHFVTKNRWHLGLLQRMIDEETLMKIRSPLHLREHGNRTSEDHHKNSTCRCIIICGRFTLTTVCDRVGACSGHNEAFLAEFSHI